MFCKVFKKLFGKKEQVAEYVNINRRGYIITLDKQYYNNLVSNGILVRLVMRDDKNTPSSVQLWHKRKYLGTIKADLGVKSFLDGNVCNFTEENLIYC